MSQKTEIAFSNDIYKISTPLQSPYLDFGNVIVNSLGLCNFSIKNCKDERIKLAFKSSSETIVRVYKVSGWDGASPMEASALSDNMVLMLLDSRAASPGVVDIQHQQTGTSRVLRKERILEAIESKRDHSRNPTIRSHALPLATNDSKEWYESLAVHAINESLESGAVVAGVSKGRSLHRNHSLHGVNVAAIPPATAGGTSVKGNRFAMASEDQSLASDSEGNSPQLSPHDHATEYLDLALTSPKKRRPKSHLFHSYEDSAVPSSAPSSTPQNAQDSQQPQQQTLSINTSLTNGGGGPQRQNGFTDSVSEGGDAFSDADLNLTSLVSPNLVTNFGYTAADDSLVSNLAPQQIVDLAIFERLFTISDMANPKLDELVNASCLHLLENSLLTLPTLLLICQCISSNIPPMFPKHLDEEIYVKMQSIVQAEVSRLLKDRVLEPVSTGLEIASTSEVPLVAIYHASAVDPVLAQLLVQGKSRKYDLNLSFVVLEPKHMTENSGKELLVKSTLGKSLLELGQNNINFGVIDKGERGQQCTVIRNKSELPLLYAIQKSGTMVSGHIIIPRDRFGVLRAYEEREIAIFFESTISRAFNERVVIENVMDKDETQTLVVKATVKKRSYFSVKTKRVDFGVLQCTRQDDAIFSGTLSRSSSRDLLSALSTQSASFSSQSSLTNFAMTSNFIKSAEDDAPVPQSNYMILQNLSTKHARYLEASFTANEDVQLFLSQTDGDGSNSVSFQDWLKLDMHFGYLKQQAANGSEQLPPNLNLTSADERSVSRTLESAEQFAKTNSAVVCSPAPVGSSSLLVDADQSLVLLTEEAREQIEELEQKLKIAQRKGREEKVQSIVEKLSRLKRGLSTAPSFDTTTAGQQGEQSSVQLPLSLDRHKKGKNNIVLPLEPLHTASVKLCLSATLIGTPPPSLSGRTLCANGVIRVHEHRNTDVMRTVKFQAILNLPAWTELTTNFLGELAQDLMGSHDSLALTKTASAVVFETLKIDLRRVVVNRYTECYFQVTNVSPDPNSCYRVNVNFELSSPNFSKNTRQELPILLCYGDCQRVYLSLLAESLGRQSYTLVVEVYSVEDGALVERNSLAYDLLGIESAYLSFPGLSTGPDLLKPELDLGICYVDRESLFARVRPVVVANVSETDLVLRISSNLAQQCLLYRDASLQLPLTKPFVLEKKARSVIYVAIQAHRSATPLSVDNASVQQLLNGGGGRVSPRLEKPGNSQIRQLVGGIKFAIYLRDTTQSCKDQELDLSHCVQVMTQVVKLSATIGFSLIDVDKRLLDKGLIEPSDGPVSCSLQVGNIGQLPASFFVKLPDSLNVEPRECSLEPGESCTLNVTFHVTKKGYFSEYFFVQNSFNPLQVFPVEVRAFADPQVVGVRLANSDEVASTAVVRWRDLYVHFAGSSQKLALSKRPLQIVQLSNLDGVKERVLSVAANVDLVFYTVYSAEHCESLLQADETQQQALLMALSNQVNEIKCGQESCSMRESALSRGERETGWVEGTWKQFEAPVVLPAGGNVWLALQPPLPATLLSRQEGWTAPLKSGKIIQIAGLLRFSDASQSLTTNLVVLESYVCMSWACVEPRELDLGKVVRGNSDILTLTPFQFTLRNQSLIPLLFQIDRMDPCLKLCKIHEVDVLEPFAIKRIGRLKERVFQLNLLASHPSLDQPGHYNRQICITNLRNPSNPMIFNLKFHLIYPKVFSL